MAMVKICCGQPPLVPHSGGNNCPSGNGGAFVPACSVVSKVVETRHATRTLGAVPFPPSGGVRGAIPPWKGGRGDVLILPILLIL